MRKNPSKVKAAVAAFVFAVGMLAEGDFGDLAREGNFTSSAGAVIGRPLTPLSYAGVARRTTRRTIRRSTIYAASLPPGCATIIINGLSMWQCGATYYQSQGGQYVVVYVN